MIVFELDYNITPKMREDWHSSCKKKIADGEINSLDELSKDFVETIKIYILKDHGINEDKLEELLGDKDKKDTVQEKMRLINKTFRGDRSIQKLKISYS